MVRILHDDWLIRLGENRPDQSSQRFGGYAVAKALLRPPCVSLAFDILFEA